jgi:hypothetical protein
MTPVLLFGVIHERNLQVRVTEECSVFRVQDEGTKEPFLNTER